MLSSDVMTSLTESRTKLTESYEDTERKDGGKTASASERLVAAFRHRSLTWRKRSNKEVSSSVNALMTLGTRRSQHSVKGTRPKILGSR